MQERIHDGKELRTVADYLRTGYLIQLISFFVIAAVTAICVFGKVTITYVLEKHILLCADSHFRN